MTASAEERRRLASQARSLEEIELDVDDVPAPEVRRAVISEENERRAALGIPPLIDEEEDPPELGLYRRAKALGMVGRPRR